MKGSKGFLGTHGKIPRGTLHSKGTASVKLGHIRTPYKDKILGR